MYIMGNKLQKGFWTREREERIIVQGLYDAGKTTILNNLKLGDVTLIIPTIGWNIENVTYKNLTLTSWDCGGRCPIRALYRHYYQNTSAVIFVVDSSDTYRLQDAKYELHQALQEESLKDAVFVVLANKQDLPDALPVATIAEKLELHKMKQIGTIFGTCATDRDGLCEALNWIPSVKDKVKKEQKQQLAASSGPGVITRTGDFFTKGIKAMIQMIQ